MQSVPGGSGYCCHVPREHRRGALLTPTLYSRLVTNVQNVLWCVSVGLVVRAWVGVLESSGALASARTGGAAALGEILGYLKTPKSRKCPFCANVSIYLQHFFKLSRGNLDF